jgi:hypothetical protein
MLSNYNIYLGSASEPGHRSASDQDSWKINSRSWKADLSPLAKGKRLFTFAYVIMQRLSPDVARYIFHAYNQLFESHLDCVPKDWAW